MEHTKQNEYHDFFMTNNKSGWKTVENKLRNNNPEIHELIIKFSNENNLDGLRFKEKIWCFINNVTSVPKCTCGKENNFTDNLRRGYNKHCSVECGASDVNRNLIVEETSLKKYGVKHPSMAKSVRDKYKQTCVDKYGVDNISKLDRVIQIREKKSFEKYGVKTPLILGVNREKLKKYFSDNKENLNDKRAETNKLRYGHSNLMYVEEFKAKQKETLLRKYNVTNPMFNKEFKEKNIINTKNKKFNNFISKFNSDIDNVLSWYNDNLFMKCKKCENEYTISRELFTLRNKKKKPTCTICNPFYKKDSHGENEVYDFLIGLLGDNIEINNRKILNGKELDIIIDKHNLAIEFNGLYWHNELFVDKNYHINKTKKCKENNIRLIHIFEDEWVYKEDIVKSRLKNILGLAERKIYARKCEIREVKNNDAKNFLNENHIQGTVKSKYKIGLYYDNELISIMTFGNGRIIMGGKKNELELLRFCNKLNTSVLGGASKLLNYFIKTYNPKKIISYADRRWSEGELYEKLNFTLVSESKPNYWYVIKNKREYRFKYRKSMLVKEGFDDKKSERDIMFERGLYRIYDCGALRYEINF
jgi:hypothetical protein